MNRLEIEMSATTDPQLLNDILHNDMLLDDLPEFTAKLDTKLYVPEPLAPMLSTIRNSIIEKHPAILEFVCTALQKNLIPHANEKTKTILTRTMNHMFLLEELTKEMGNSPQFMDAVMTHLFKKREEMGAYSGIDILWMTGSVFDALKTVSIDDSMARWLKSRYNRSISYKDNLLLQWELPFNILEATATDAYYGFTANAKSGAILAWAPLPILSVTGENQIINFELPAKWTNLYETWNLTFCLGHKKHPNMLFPKLLIPSVIDAKPNEYIFYRVLSLWTSINFYLFAELKNDDALRIPQSDELTILWGEINLKYANEYNS